MYNAASVRDWLRNVGLDPVLECNLDFDDPSSPTSPTDDDSSARVSPVPPVDDVGARVSSVPPADDVGARASTPNADPGPFTPPEECGPRSCKRRRKNRG